MRRMLLKTRIPALVTVLLIAAGFPGLLQASDWWQNIEINGDLRYRHEMIDEESKDARHRHRIRARIGVYGKVSSYTKVGIQLATGSDDPVSTNQTLDGAFSTKQIGLDLAYLETSHDALPGLKVIGGKFKNPFYKPGKSELIWDSDWNPEGGAITYKYGSDDFSVLLIGGGLWVDERSSSKDSWMGAGQAVARFHIDEKKTSVAAGGGYFNYENTKGFQPFFDPDDPLGNSVTTKEADDESLLYYANDFEILELFVEANHKFGCIPVTVMGDFVTNTAADSLDTGWLVGIRAGKAKTPGSWECRYIYREVEKDAVIGIFTDSDFRGGGTDAKGHEIGGAVQLAGNTAFKATYFINEIGLQKSDMDKFNRLQVDLQLRF